jgi:hypothetical protein
LLYDIDQSRFPLQSEYSTVANITAAYLNDYFLVNFESTSLVVFKDAQTMMISNSFVFGQPVAINYNTTLEFGPASFVPDQAGLQATLESAFTGQNLQVYVGILQNLPLGNIFSTTSSVEYDPNPALAAESPTASSSDSTAKTAGIAAAVGASAFLMVLAGLVIYRRSYDGEDEIRKYIKDDAHTTCDGETCVAGSSNDSQSEREPRLSRRNDAESSISASEWGDHQLGATAPRTSSQGILREESREECEHKGSTGFAEIKL